MKQILLISETIQEINRLRRYFDEGYAVKAVSSVITAQTIIHKAKPDLIIFSLGSDFSRLFPFYTYIRTNSAFVDIPMIVIADIVILKSLTENVELKKSTILSATVSKENLLACIEDYL